MKKFLIPLFLVALLISPQLAKADPTPYYFNAAAGSAWDDLGSWWYDPDYTIPADTVPVDGDIYIDAAMETGPSAPTTVNSLFVGTVQPNTVSYFNGEITVSTNAVFGTQGVAAVDTGLAIGGTINGNAIFYSNTHTSGNITGDVSFYETSRHSRGLITGSADYYDSSVFNFVLSGDANPSVDGIKRRHFLQNSTTTLDFANSGPWTVIANNAQVSVGSSTIDATIGSPTFTTLETVGTGTFIYSPPTTPTLAATEISQSSATLNGSVTSIGGQSVLERGFIYGLTTAYGATTSDSGVFSIGNFSEDIDNLLPKTRYHFRAFARNSTGIQYGDDKYFTTYPINPPELILLSATTTGSSPYSNVAVSTSTFVTIGFSCACLTVHDVSDKSNPIVIATSSTNGGPIYAASENNYVYVSTSGGKLETWDFSTPTSPNRLGVYSYPAGYGLGKMRIDNGHLFVTFSRTGDAGPGGATIFSISDPATTTVLSTILHASTTSGGGDVLPIGNYLYIADYIGYTLSVYDISNISSPSLRQRLTGITEPLDYRTFEPWGLDYKGDALYLVDDNILQIYDISSSTNMVYSSTIITLKDTEGAKVRDNFLYFAGSGVGANADRRIQIYDVTDPFNPFVTTDFFTGINNYWINFDADGYIYINAAAQNLLSIFSAIKTPAVLTSAATNVTTNSLTLNGSISSNNNSSSTDRGFNWGTTSSYGNVASTTGLFSAGSFSQNLSGLTCGTTYHYQAFATNYIGTATTSDSTFTTLDCSAVSSGGGSSSGSRASAPKVPITFFVPSAPTTQPSNLNQTPSSLLAQFSRNLTVGSSGLDVQTLQKYLNAKGFTVALTGPGSPGNETSFFGALTRAALARFQKANNISPAVGYFGPITRAFVAKNP